MIFCFSDSVIVAWLYLIMSGFVGYSKSSSTYCQHRWYLTRARRSRTEWLCESRQLITDREQIFLCVIGVQNLPDQTPVNPVYCPVRKIALWLLSVNGQPALPHACQVLIQSLHTTFSCEFQWSLTYKQSSPENKKCVPRVLPKRHAFVNPVEHLNICSYHITILFKSLGSVMLKFS